MKKMLATIVSMFAMLFMFSSSAFAATSFSEALPASLIPDGFWDGVAIVILFTAALTGVVKFLKLIKRA